MKTSISVIVVTYNRSRSARETVHSLLSQSAEPHEIILIDDCPASPLTEVFTWKKLKILRFDREFGVSASRNHAIKIAEGAYVAFIDDDAVADTNWLYEVQKGLDMGADIVGGPIKAFFKAIPPKWWDEKTFGHYVSIGNAPNKYADYPPGIWSCNMALRKKILKTVGDFNTEVGRKGGKLLAREDVDLVNRAREKGYKILFLPDAIVYHKVESERLTIPYILKWEFYMGRTYRLLYGYRPLKAFFTFYRSVASLILTLFMGEPYQIIAIARIANSLGQL